MGRIERQSLAQQMATVLENDIRSGVWSVTLPGYRVLQEYYSVSKVTCERALALLEMKGLLAAAEPRKRRGIFLKATTKGMPSLGTLLMVSDISHQLDPEHNAELDLVAAFWKQRGGTILRKQIDLRRKHDHASLLAAWQASSPIDAAWFLIPPPSWIRSAVKAGIPLFCAGGRRDASLKQITLCGLSVEVSFGVILKHLREMGHQRILIPWKQSSAMLRPTLIRVFKHIYGDLLSDRQIEEAVPVRDFQSPDDWHHFWPEALSKQQPTAVAITKPLEAVSLVTFCGSAGIRIPGDLSVVVADQGPSLDWVTPRLCYLKTADKAGLKSFQRWVRSGFIPRGFLPVPIELIAGDSVAGLTTGP